MEAKGDRKKWAWALLAEAFGTAFLALGVNWRGVGNGAPVAVGLALFMALEVLGPIGGGQFNPAVTLALIAKCNQNETGMSLAFGLLTILAQLIGATLGCVGSLAALQLGPLKATGAPGAGSRLVPQLCPVAGCNDGGGVMFQVVLVETAMTFIFVALVLQVQRHNGARDAPVNAVAIGAGLYVCCQTAAGISGGCLNPAIGLVQPFFQ